MFTQIHHINTLTHTHKCTKTFWKFIHTSWWNLPAGVAAVLTHLQAIRHVNVIVYDIVHLYEHLHLNHLLNPVQQRW